MRIGKIKVIELLSYWGQLNLKGLNKFDKNAKSPFLETISFLLFRRRRNLLISLLISIIVAGSCTPSTFKTEEELIAYVRDEDNGLIKKQHRNGLDVALIYRPTDLIINQELRSKDSITEDGICKLEEQYGKYAYFVLSYSQNNKEALYTRSAGYSDFSENLQKLSFRMDDYVYMTTNQKDTLYLSDFYYARMHGMGTATQVLLAFERKEIEKSAYATLHIKDVGFGTGRINFKIRSKDIKNIPEIEFLEEN